MWCFSYSSVSFLVVTSAVAGQDLAHLHRPHKLVGRFSGKKEKAQA